MQVKGGETPSWCLLRKSLTPVFILSHEESVFKRLLPIYNWSDRNTFQKYLVPPLPKYQNVHTPSNSCLRPCIINHCSVLWFRCYGENDLLPKNSNHHRKLANEAIEYIPIYSNDKGVPVRPRLSRVPTIFWQVVVLRIKMSYWVWFETWWRDIFVIFSGHAKFLAPLTLKNELTP